MNTPPAADCSRQTGWNGLQFRRSPAWEAIVAGPRHLLIENGLQPIMEIRWDTSGKSSVDQVIRAATGQLTDGDGTVQRMVNLPEPFDSLQFNGISGLSWHDDLSLDGLVWQCPTCRTVLFCHLSLEGASSHAVAELLKTMRCHQAPEEDSLWAVQDFRLSLPPGYTFIDSTFTAGFSRLAFTGHDAQLQFCRLAPASARLVQNSLHELLTSMLASRDRQEILTHSIEHCELHTVPATARRLMAKLSRKPVFTWGSIWHDARHNRLLSLIAESRRPIKLDTVRHLTHRYEILPLH